MRRAHCRWWLASKERRGKELIAAGLLMLAERVDHDDLAKWIRVGWERRRGGNVGVWIRPKLKPHLRLSGGQHAARHQCRLEYRLQ